MGRKFTDNALTTLASSITNVATTLAVAAGKGNNFPAVIGKGTPGSAVDYFVITLEDASGNREKIRVEQRALGVDSFGSGGYPLVRGYDGTVARSWNAGDSVDLRFDKSEAQDLHDKVLGVGAAARLFGPRQSTTNGLTLGYYGGKLLVDGVITNIPDDTIVLTASQTNYVERTPAGVVSANIVGYSADKIPLFTIITDVDGITSIADDRSANMPAYGMLTKDIAGTGDITLSAEEARAPTIRFTGLLTGARNVIFPNVKRTWIIVNDTTGFFRTACKVAGQAGAIFYQGRATLMAGNGTDMKKVADDPPPGTILDFGADAIPSGYALACDGANFTRATNSALFTEVGTTWGAGDGVTTATAPDSRRRASVGKGGTGTGTLGNAVGNAGGAETHTLAQAELPAAGLSVPALSIPALGVSASGTFVGNNGAAGGTNAPLLSVANDADANLATNYTSVSVSGATGGSATGGGTTGAMGSGSAHNNLGPRFVVTKMIKT